MIMRELRLRALSITNNHIKQGLERTVWQARLQHLTRHPYNKLLPENIALWLDGGHNPQGGEVLGNWLAEQAKTHDIYLICGMMKGASRQAGEKGALREAFLI